MLERITERPAPTPPKKLILQCKGRVFAKSCNLPDGVIDHQNPNGFVPVERLSDYGTWAVFAPSMASGTHPTPLHAISTSSSASTFLSRLGGHLSLLAAEGSAVAGGLAIGSVGLLIPNTTLSADSAFYTDDQYGELSVGRTRVRFNIKQLPDGAVSAYGFYTGGKTDWENVPVVTATRNDNTFTASLGNGLDIIWTPASKPDDKPGVPPLQAGPRLSNIWVYPPTSRSDQILVNPEHPPEFNDAIIWFPQSDIPPIYVVLSKTHQNYSPPPKQLVAFPNAKKATRRTPVKGGGGLRQRWKDPDGVIYEWDSRHGRVEMYNKRGKHLGEFDSLTGKQTKSADKTRSVEP